MSDTKKAGARAPRSTAKPGRTAEQLGSTQAEARTSRLGERAGITSDSEPIDTASLDLAVTDGFGPWLLDQAGRLDPDFALEPDR